MNDAPVALPRELDVARGAVRAAAALARAVYGKLGAAALEKRDRSPVTVADFAVQAIVGATLRAESGVTALVGEESAAELRGDDAAAVRREVVAQVGALRGAGVGDEQVLDWIDVGAFDPHVVYA